MATPPLELTGALADRYRFDGEIGSGGMATVYAAEDLKHHRRVAVKVLRSELAAEVGPQRFLREIEIAARLQHPHILMLLDSGEVEGLLFYVMPLIEGPSLRDRLARTGELPIADAIRVLRDVADALSYAHAHGVVHRDIKPDNVMMSGRHALVTDFGVARAVSEATGHDRLTSTGIAVGTVAYMAPEQAAGDGKVDHRADIYGFGALAYELLTGRPPFVRATAQSLLAAHLTSVPEPLEQLRPSVPPVLAGIVMRCLEKSSADRWQSADELVAALEALVTPPAGTASIAPGVPEAGRRPRRSLVTVAVALVLAIAAAVVWSQMRRPPGPLSENAFAVLPFDILGPDVEDVGGAISEAVHHRLDGAGALTGVPLSAIGRRWSGPADRTSALRLAREVSAGVVLYGRVASASGDSIRITASLLDVAADRFMGEYEATAPAGGWLDASDDLAVWTLEAVSRDRRIAAVPLRSIGSDDPAAVKAFITGDGYYRRSDYDSAQVYYDQALALDSTFALAYSRRGRSNWNRDRAYAADFLRAGALNRGLARREMMVLAWDSLYAAFQTGFTGDGASWSRFERLREASERFARGYPLDAEAWYTLGEWRYHLGPYSGVTDEEARRAFAESLRLDPGFGESRLHLILLTLHADGPEATRRFIRESRQHARGISAERDSLLLLAIDAHLAGGAPGPAALSTFSRDALLGASYVLKQWPDGEAAATFARAAGTTGYTFRIPRALAYRGHFDEAREWLERGGSAFAATLYPAMARLGGVPADSADTVFRTALADTAASAASVRPWYQALRWWQMRGDSSTLRRVVRETLDRLVRAPPPDTAFIGYVGRAARAYLELVAGDTTAALRGLEQLPTWPAQNAFHEWLARAELLEALGRADEAAELLAHPPLPHDWGLSPEWVLADLVRGRVHEQLGRRDDAIAAYSTVERLWRDADPAVQTYVDEARQALERLVAEPSG